MRTRKVKRESFIDCDQALEDIRIQVWKDGKEVTVTFFGINEEGVPEIE